MWAEKKRSTFFSCLSIYILESLFIKSLEAANHSLAEIIFILLIIDTKRKTQLKTPTDKNEPKQNMIHKLNVGE